MAQLPITPPAEAEHGSGPMDLAASPQADSLDFLLDPENVEDVEPPAAFFCSGHPSPGHASLHPRTYLATGELERWLNGHTLPRPAPSAHAHSFFGHDYPLAAVMDPTSCVWDIFYANWDALFFPAQNANQATPTHCRGTQPGLSDLSGFSSQLRSFLAWVRFASSCPTLLATQSDFNLAFFLRSLQDLHRGLEVMRDLPVHVLVANAVNEDNRNLPSHYFHLILDGLWTVYVALRSMSLSSRNFSELLRIPGWPPGFCAFQGLAGPTTNVSESVTNPEIESFKREVSGRIYCELTFLLRHRFDRLGIRETWTGPTNFMRLSFFNYSSFNCTCIRDLFLMLFHVESSGNVCHFWTDLRLGLSAQYQVELADSSTCMAPLWEPELITLGRNPQPLKSVEGQMFMWWVIFHVSAIFHLDCQGRGVSDSNSLPQEFVHVIEKQVKESVQLMGDAHEIEMRTILWTLIRVFPLSGPSFNVLHMLWDYFHKRLNDHFSAMNSVAVVNLALLPKSIRDWDKSLPSPGDERDFQSCLVKAKERNSFELFLKLLQLYLSSNDALKLRAKISGRILSKLPSKRLLELTQVGWFHLISLQIVIFRCSTAQDAQQNLSRIQGLISSIKYKELHPKKRVVILQGMATLARVSLDKDQDPVKAISVLMGVLNHTIDETMQKRSDNCLQRLAQSCMEVWTQFMEEALLSPSTELTLIQSQLLSPQLGSYMKHFSSNELHSIISQLSGFVMKIRRFYDAFNDKNVFAITEEESITKEKIDQTHALLWSRVFQLIHQDLALRLIGPHEPMAELVVGLLLMLIQGQMPASVNLKPFSHYFQFFAQSEAVNPNFASHFLLNVVESAQSHLRESLINLEQVIKGWIRVGMLTTKDSTNYATFQALSKEVFVLEELNGIKPYMTSDEDQHPLVIFITALGNLTKMSDNHLKSLRSSYTQYLLIAVESLRNLKKFERTNPSVVLHLYQSAALMIEKCARLLYDHDTNEFNHLGPILNELFVPNVIQNPKYNLPELYQKAVRQTLSQVI
ncbi:hypothetical protein TCAL_14743 [Tigriopus californicus]|uniref:Protein MMS22-like N-terminal domain-containing protein n=1 Tax=Tigriopus californicus TaxID=6832 RepID=A0A553PGM6_TIGCA|nr:hypothetical protein TCAL_14743 [Tigriopus californicus]